MFTVIHYRKTPFTVVPPNHKLNQNYSNCLFIYTLHLTPISSILYRATILYLYDSNGAWGRGVGGTDQ